jgi:hypothetical protein
MARARALWGLVALLGCVACTERALEVELAPADLAAAQLDAADADGADASVPDLLSWDALAFDAAPGDAGEPDAALPDAAVPGLAWRALPSGTTMRLQAVWGSSAHDVWAVGYAFVHGTGDPISFSPVSVPAQGLTIGGNGVDDFWVGGRYLGGGNLGGVMFHGSGDPTTFDNTPLLNGWGLYGLWAQSAESYWAVGDGAVVVHGQGAPMSWTKLVDDGYGFGPHIDYAALTGCRQLFAIWGAGNEIWAVGSGEGIVHGGADPSAWTSQHSGTGGSGGGCSAGDIENFYSSDLRGIWGSSATDLWAVGHDGTILHGTGSPTTWVKVASGTTEHLTSVWGASATDVWAVGTGGSILHGSGAPLAWTPVPSGTTKGLYGIWGLSPTNIWAVGDKGTILHYSD